MFSFFLCSSFVLFLLFNNSILLFHLFLFISLSLSFFFEFFLESISFCLFFFYNYKKSRAKKTWEKGNKKKEKIWTILHLFTIWKIIQKSVTVGLILFLFYQSSWCDPYLEWITWYRLQNFGWRHFWIGKVSQVDAIRITLISLRLVQQGTQRETLTKFYQMPKVPLL